MWIASVSLAASLFVTGRPDTHAVAPPKDPCTLLKSADVQTLEPKAKMSDGAVTQKNAVAATCTYTWGPKTKEGQTTFTVMVVDQSRAWEHLSESEIRVRMTGEIRAAGPTAEEIPGIGDGAVFKADPKSHTALAVAYLVKTKHMELALKLRGGVGLARKDQLIALLKAAAAAL